MWNADGFAWEDNDIDGGVGYRRFWAERLTWTIQAY